MKTTGNKIVSMIGLAAACAIAPTVQAHDAVASYPDKVVRIVMPFPPGGMGDTLARLLASKLSEQWGQTVIVDNKPGASGMIGNKFVAGAPPDGYTLLLTITQVVQAPSLYADDALMYDITKDFTPLSKVANALSLFVARQDAGITSLDSYVKLARTNPGKYSYASYGNGTTSHIYAQIFNRRNDLDVAHVPYRGAAPLLNDLMGGHVDLSFVDLSTALPFIQSGRINAYAVVSSQRSAALPDVPTFKELGYDGMEVVGWYGLLGPADMPEALAEKISAAVQQAVTSPDVQKRIADLGLEPVGTDGETFSRIIQEDTVTWRNIIQEGGVKLD